MQLSKRFKSLLPVCQHVCLLVWLSFGTVTLIFVYMFERIEKAILPGLSYCHLPVLALTAIELHPPETLRVDKDAPGTATCLTSSGAPPPPPVEWRVNNEVVSSAGSITVRKNVLTVAYAEDLNKAVIFCKVNDITSNKVTVGMNISVYVFICC